MPTCLKDFATATVVVAEPETTALTAAMLMRKHTPGSCQGRAQLLRIPSANCVTLWRISLI